MPLPGITLGDCGMKEGLDGIDNGFILFDNIRIPKANFLNRLSDISEDGKFSSPIENSDQRFALSLGGLSTGRIILIQNMINYLCLGIKTAIRFSAMRRQFGDPKSSIEQ
jgi:acyl-CoA oxidase